MAANMETVMPVCHGVNSTFVRNEFTLLHGRFAPNISSGLSEVADQIANAVKPSVYNNPATYDPRLTHIVTARTSKKTLYVAIGPGDFLSSWLPRIWRPTDGEPKPAISKLVVLSLSRNTGKRLQSDGKLARDFMARISASIAKLRVSLPIPIVHKNWASEPEFHGFIYGDVALVNKWGSMESGEMHVETPLIEVSKNYDLEQFSKLRRAFRNSV